MTIKELFDAEKWHEGVHLGGSKNKHNASLDRLQAAVEGRIVELEAQVTNYAQALETAQAESVKLKQERDDWYDAASGLSRSLTEECEIRDNTIAVLELRLKEETEGRSYDKFHDDATVAVLERERNESVKQLQSMGEGLVNGRACK
ncbi:MAG: hypothetical protein HGA87_03310 [Desulfobulbaceae bacterium]|nr:hypothetical protein [Desulfobulbaceae bacterium]